MKRLCNRDILSAEQFTPEEIWLVLRTAQQMEHRVERERKLDVLQGYILATVFYEPSTRTRLSFEAAMHRMGGDVLSVAEAKTSSSAVKGESLADTARTVEQYCDVIALRHPLIGSAQQMADAASVPVINAGDGAGQHPTQALLDAYTIWKEHGQLEDLTISLVGDLKHGRTVHSLAMLLSLFGIQLQLVAPPALAMPREIIERVRSRGSAVVETDGLDEASRLSDVLYVTRIQKERFENPDDYEKLRGAYVVDRALVEGCKPGTVVMHPLPRVDEIDKDVDDLTSAAYFRQVRNGLYVRMALLALVLK
jgi:aspartate carbamoyltransferase